MACLVMGWASAKWGGDNRVLFSDWGGASMKQSSVMGGYARLREELVNNT